MLDTDQLRSFLAIVDSGSFTKAAERVHKTQSAVSMHIRRLEEQLGCALFVKQGRGARLTDEGEKLIEFARRIVQVEAGAFAALSRKGLRGAARLGIPDDYAESFLADILAHFNRRHPLGRGLRRLRGVDRPCSAGRRRRARSRADHRPRGPEGARTFARGAPGLGRFRAIPGGGGNADPARARQHDLLLAARDRASADHSARRASRGRGSISKNFSAIGTVLRAGLAATILPARWSVPASSASGAPKDLPELPLNRMGLIHAPGRPERRGQGAWPMRSARRSAPRRAKPPEHGSDAPYLNQSFSLRSLPRICLPSRLSLFRRPVPFSPTAPLPADT